jgi:hypothetical protein
LNTAASPALADESPGIAAKASSTREDASGPAKASGALPPDALPENTGTASDTPRVKSVSERQFAAKEVRSMAAA